MANRLVVAPAWLGDMVMAQSLLMVLQEQHPQDRIHVLAPASTYPLLTRMPQVHRSFYSPTSHGALDLKARFELAKKLRQYQYVQAVVLPNSLKSALIPFWAKVQQRTGWLGEYRFGLLNDIHYRPKQHKKMVQRFVALASHESLASWSYPEPCLQIDEHNMDDLKKRFALSTTQPVVALCPGAAFGPAKRWPVAYFAELAGMILQQGWQVWLLGGPAERPLAASIQAANHHQCTDLVGQSSLTDVVDLLAMAHMVVSNDSGLMHVAAALAKPMVVIYGSTDHEFTPPLTSTAKLLAKTLPCRPCFQRQCPLEHLRCLQDIKPLVVWQSLKTIDESLAH